MQKALEIIMGFLHFQHTFSVMYYFIFLRANAASGALG